MRRVRDGLHQGRDRADLAVLRAVRLPRRWLFFAPFVCLAAARVLAGRRSYTTAVLAALAAQAVVHELLFDTVW